jgi:hypothetical protein
VVAGMVSSILSVATARSGSIWAAMVTGPASSRATSSCAGPLGAAAEDLVRAPTATATGGDARTARWCPLEAPPPLAFDHAEVIGAAVAWTL